LKNLTEERIDAALIDLKPNALSFIKDFKKHQKIGFLLGVCFPQFYFIYDMGSGKTMLSLRLLAYHYMTKQILGISVVLVPTDASALGWEDEINKWVPDMPYRVLLGSSAAKWKSLAGFNKGVLIITYIGYASMVSELRPSARDPDRNKRQLSKSLVEKFCKLVDALVMDESTNVANVQSLVYAATRELSFTAAVRYALAGRPFGRDPMMLWSQCFLVDHGASLSHSLGMFREVFFTKKKAFWGINSYDYTLNKKRQPDLARALAHRSLPYSIDECVDLPETVPVIRRVSFPIDTEAYYKRVVHSLVEHKGNYREVENAFIKMRQIASGFLGFTDDETGEKAQVEFKDNPKLDDLMLLLETMPRDEKALVFHEFTWTGARICRELTKAKIKHGWLWGGTKDWATMKDKLDNDPDYRVQVINHKKGAFSLNLQRASWEFFFESPVSPIAREQAERRARRQGQTRKVMMYDLVVRDSVEERILDFHKEGVSLMDALVSNPQLLIRV
jgi:SNF2 family DNA or RNA helicase